MIRQSRGVDKGGRPEALDSPELGIEILSVLRRLYPAQFKLDRTKPLVANMDTIAEVPRGEYPRSIAQGWTLVSSA